MQKLCCTSFAADSHVRLEQNINDMLRKEFQYYLEHQAELVPLYEGKYVMIVGEEVVGAYTSAAEACYVGKQKYGAGNFLLQLCTSGESAYTITYHSRAI